MQLSCPVEVWHRTYSSFVNNPVNLAAFEYPKNAENEIVYMALPSLKIGSCSQTLPFSFFYSLSSICVTQQ